VSQNRILLIGCGLWGQKILLCLSKHNIDIEVYDLDKNIVNTVALCGGKSIALLEQDREYNGIIIATPSSTHFDILEKVVTWNIPIFVEKPLVTSLKDARALLALDSGLIYVMHIWLYHEGIQILRQKKEEGTLGKLLQIRTTRANWTSPRIDTDTAWNFLPHDLSIVRYILGYLPELKQVIKEEHPHMTRGVTVLCGNKPSVIIEVSNRYERKIREVRLHFEKGIVILSNEKDNYVTTYLGDEHSVDFHISKTIFKTKDQPLDVEITEFVNYINGGTAPRVDLSASVELIEYIDKIENFKCL